MRPGPPWTTHYGCEMRPPPPTSHSSMGPPSNAPSASLHHWPLLGCQDCPHGQDRWQAIHGQPKQRATSTIYIRTVCIRKRGLCSLLAEHDALEDGHHEISSEWFVGKHL